MCDHDIDYDDLRDEDDTIEEDEEDIYDEYCGLCGEEHPDKMAKFTCGGIYWPGERVPDTDLVHAECEIAECERAFNALTQDQREEVLRSIWQ